MARYIQFTLKRSLSQTWKPHTNMICLIIHVINHYYSDFFQINACSNYYYYINCKIIMVFWGGVYFQACIKKIAFLTVFSKSKQNLQSNERFWQLMAQILIQIYSCKYLKLFQNFALYLSNFLNCVPVKGLNTKFRFSPGILQLFDIIM